MDDLYSAQFDLLVRVMSHLTSERDYKLLLLLENIWEVVDNSEEFIPQEVPTLNFTGSLDAWARERVQSNLHDLIKEATTEDMPEDELGN